MDVLMGDLVLLQDEVNPVMSALLEQGLDVTALHNHFFWDQPRTNYMHVHGIGSPDVLASEVTPVLRALRAHGLDVVAIHHHMTDTQPATHFLHHWGTGRADALAAGVRAAVNQTGPRASTRQRHFGSSSRGRA